MAGISGDSSTVGEPAVLGTFNGYPQVEDPRNYAAGVLGGANGQPGVWGISQGAPGVYGEVQGAGSIAVRGMSGPDDNGDSGTGVHGLGSIGVLGDADVLSGASGTGVKGYGRGDTGVGVIGESDFSNGVLGISHHPTNAAVSAVNQGGGFGLWVETSGSVAVHIQGHTETTGDINVAGDVYLANKDICELFPTTTNTTVEHGAVMVAGMDGTVGPCQRQYDKGVVGVVSGAGDLRPAITLGSLGRDRTAGVPIALVGTAYCRVDADHAAVAVGDLLTSSNTPGHAMKAVDPAQSFGAVIGKALAPLANGQGMIPIVIALR